MLYKKCQNCKELIEIRSEDSIKIFCNNYCRYRHFIKLHPEKKLIYLANKNKRQQTTNLPKENQSKGSITDKITSFFKNVWGDKE